MDNTKQQTEYTDPIDRGEWSYPVDQELFDRVIADPEWAARVIKGAAEALNTLAFYSANWKAQKRDFRHPNAEAVTAQQILRTAFFDRGLKLS